MSVYSISSDEYSSEEEEVYHYSGDVLKNRYVLIKKLGKGMSVVWLALDIYSGDCVAVKIINPDEYDVAQDEINKLIKIKNSKYKYLNKLIDHFKYKINSDEYYTCIVLELMACSLDDLLIKDKKYSSGFNYETVKMLSYQLLKGMENLHKIGIIHTDIKPENILVKGTNLNLENLLKSISKFNFVKQLRKNKNKLDYTAKKLIKFLNIKDDISEESDDENTEIINENKKLDTVLSDFGNSKFTKNLPSIEIQTRYYRAPEVILDIPPYNYKTDMWSVGCTIFEMLFSEILFDPQKCRGFNRDREHIYLIIKYFGLFKKEHLQKSSKYDVFFTTKGLLKRRDFIEYKPFDEFIKDKIKKNNLSISDEEIDCFISFLSGFFYLEPSKRWSFEDVFKHPWFKRFQQGV